MGRDEDTRARVDRWIKPAVREMKAYPVALSEGLVKLDAMENPYTWPEGMVEAWLEALRDAPVNRYPDAAARPLREALAHTFGLPAGLEVLLGNGSDELIQLLVLALGGAGRTVVAPEPSFVMYRLVCRFTDTDYVGVPLKEDWSLDAEAMLEAVQTHQPSLVFMAYPNNPTGNLFDREAMDAVIRAAPGVVVVDEAYEPFARATYADRIAEFPNLLVMRTVSKLGLAGLRLGYLIGEPAWVEELDKLRLPYNINVLSQLTARFALAHYGELRRQSDRLREDRGRLQQALAAFPGLQVWPSEANFLLVRVRDGDAAGVARRLREAGVLIRVLDGAADALAGCLRISVGTPEENTALLSALEQVLSPD